jgi:hypothetical protein
MFGSEFIEKLEYKNQFIFDPEQDACSQEDFVKFLVSDSSIFFI